MAGVIAGAITSGALVAKMRTLREIIGPVPGQFRHKVGRRRRYHNDVRFPRQLHLFQCYLFQGVGEHV